MDRSLFRYIWHHSKRDQLVIFAVVFASLPFYFFSLDLPRRIVNEAIQGGAFKDGRTEAPFLNLGFSWPTWLGGPGHVTLFEGFSLDRLSLLFALSGLFLAFVCINGAFKYWINVAKGALGERMLRRMRFELFSLVLRFTPHALRSVKASETATIIKDEVEPIGGFVGDAYVLPLFLGTQAATALIFIMVQNVWLGLLAAGVVGVQFTIIPKLRRELLRLGRERQLASRRLAGRVGEIVDGMEAVQVHNTATWEKAEIGHRLYELFDIRFRIYKRKFIVKFLNNFLAQLTPFFFYSVGGYFALRGQLDIGQLVAVIAAYRELPPPLKELIDWDQLRLDVQVKYDQVVQHFAPERLLATAAIAGPLTEEQAAEHLEGPLTVTGLTVHDPHHGEILSDVSLEIPLPAAVALLGDGGPAAGSFARIVAGRSADYVGEVKYGERSVADLPAYLAGRRLAYAGIEPILFPGSIRDNLLYGLRHRPVEEPTASDAEASRRVLEARRTGNPLESIAARWIDLELAGAQDEHELDNILLEVLGRIGLMQDIYRFGLIGMVDPARHPQLAERLIEARTTLRAELVRENMADLVEPFDPGRYNSQATIGENLLFGVPIARALIGRELASHPAIREALRRADLTDDLVAMGIEIAETMTEIFRGVPHGHPLFEQFSFISADELADFERMLRRRPGGGRPTLRGEDLTRIIALPLAYIEPRHRLGLIDERMRERLVAARSVVREMLEKLEGSGVEFYDPDKVCVAAPLRDNLLFGRISQSAANAQTKVTEAITTVIEQMGLRPEIERVGLDHQVGPAGRLLTASQRASIALARSLVKRPDIFVIDGAFSPFGPSRAQELMKTVKELSAGRSLFVHLAHARDAELFDLVVGFEGAKVIVGEGAPEAVERAREEMREETGEGADPDAAGPPESGAGEASTEDDASLSVGNEEEPEGGRTSMRRNRVAGEVT